MRRTLDRTGSDDAAMSTDMHEDGDVLLAEDLGPVRRLTRSRPRRRTTTSGS